MSIVTRSGTGQGIHVIAPEGASYERNSSSNTIGCWEIHMPFGTADITGDTSYWMKVTVVDNFQFGSSQPRQIFVSGRLTTSGHVNPKAFQIDGVWANYYFLGYVRVDATTSNYVVQLGFTNQVLGKFQTVFVDEFWINTDGGLTYDDVNNGWSINTINSDPADIGNPFYAYNNWPTTPAVTKVQHHNWDTYQLISSSTSGGYYTCTDSSFTYSPQGTGKLIIVVQANVYTNNHYGGIALFINGSITGASSAGGSRNIVNAGLAHEPYANSPWTFVVEYDHSSTNNLTIDLRTQNKNYNVNWVWNRAGYHTNDPNAGYNVSSVSSITVYEVA